MRDKLIDIILTAQGYNAKAWVVAEQQARENGKLFPFVAERLGQRERAGRIADALLEAGVVIIPVVEKQYQGGNNWYRVGDKEYRAGGGGGNEGDAPGRVYIPCVFVEPPEEE